MARSPLFHRLRKLAARARAPAQQGAAPKNLELTRRELLELSAFAAAVTPLAAACADDDANLDAGGEGGGEEVAVIGGGTAGLHCAYRLHNAGVSVTVYEASARVGGRMYTARGMFPSDQVAELGGELVDSNHASIHQLCEELGLTLDDRLEDSEGIVLDTWFVNDAVVPEATVVEQFSAVAERMAADMEAADTEDDAFTELDEMTLAAYIDEVVPAADYPELNAILLAAYRGEFGLECEEQSALNMIYLIGSDAPDPFRIFGESDERYHVHGGNDQIPSKLAERIEDRIETDARLVAATRDGDRFTLSFTRDDGESFERTVDRVVFALPFTTLRRVELDDLGLSEDKRAMIDELGYGTNAKVMGAFWSRIWRTEHDASGAVTTDRPLQQTWDTSIGQDGDEGVLTNFLGGAQGIACGEGTADEWMQSVLPDLEAVFPGAADAYIADSAVRMHWPTHPHTRGSYACYKPGQWSYWPTEGEREGKLHFCGEHTSADFQGWMEGAAESGARVAVEILEDLELDVPDAIARQDAELVTAALRMPFPRRFARLHARTR